jgi:hypothetical protein
MSAVAPLPPSPVPPTPAKPAANRRSRSEEAEIVRAKKTLAALPALLAGIAKKDANAAKVRIDAAWVAQYGSILTSAEAAADGRAVARTDLRKATATERQSSTQLGALLTDVRALVATHNPDDENAQRAYGRGTVLDPRRTGPTLTLAGAVLQAWSGQWKQVGLDSGVTQSTIDQIRSLRDSLSSADTGQLGIMTSNTDGTVQRAALFKTLRTMSTFAVAVVKNVFGKASSQAQSLADPRPLTQRGATRKAATKAKKVATTVAKKAARAAKPKNRAATAKRRAKRVAVATRAAALVATAKPIAKRKAAGAKKKAAK